MIYNTYDIFKGIMCCVPCLKKVDVGYKTDTNVYKNSAIFCDTNLFSKSQHTFTIDVRGMSNKGDTTIKLANDIADLSNKIFTLKLKDNSTIKVHIFIGDFLDNGVDDYHRLSLTSEVTILSII